MQKKVKPSFSALMTAAASLAVAGLLALPAAVRAEVRREPAEPAVLRAARPEEEIRHRYLSAGRIIRAEHTAAYRPDVPLSADLQAVLYDACGAHDIPYHVALGLIEVESGFDPQAVNPATGCYGPAQLNPSFFPRNLSPADNIKAGMAYLGAQLERYGGDLPAALQSYHDGHDTGKRWYANAVLAAAEKWRLHHERQHIGPAYGLGERTPER